MPVLRIFILLLLTFSMGCDSSKFQVEEDKTDPDKLDTIVRRPAEFDANESHAMLVALHGRGDTNSNFIIDFAAYTDENMIIAVPQGDYREGSGYSWFYDTDDKSKWVEYDTEAVTKLMNTIHSLQEEYKIDKIFVLGFSQGASMAYLAGLLYPETITGVLAIGGYLPGIDTEGAIVHAQDIAEAQNLKIFAAHGTSDDIVPRSAFTAQLYFFEANQYDFIAYDYAGGHYLTTALLNKAFEWMKSQITG